MPAPTRPDPRTPAAAAWTGADFRDDDRWIHPLDAAQAAALATAGRAFADRDYTAIRADEAAAALAPLRPVVEAIRAELGGRGFALLRGVPVETMTEREIQAAYWSLGLLFGPGLTQNAQADFLCPVTDRGVDFGYSGAESQRNVRGYQSRADLNYHCDPTDVVALLCVRKALHGGASSIVSTTAIHDVIAREHPGHLAVLERGFPYDRKAEQWPTEAPVTGRIPVFETHGDRVDCRYARSYILGAAQKLAPLDADEIAALDAFDAVARRDEMPLKMAFEPGDVQFLNNLTTVHGRTAYEDDPDPARRRFLWRLWLNLGDAAPWSTASEPMRWAFARFGNLGRTVDEWRRLAAAPAAT